MSGIKVGGPTMALPGAGWGEYRSALIASDVAEHAAPEMAQAGRLDRYHTKIVIAGLSKALSFRARDAACSKNSS